MRHDFVCLIHFHHCNKTIGKLLELGVGIYVEARDAVSQTRYSTGDLRNQTGR